MICIHGLDESNCPNCRIMKFSLPDVNTSLKNVFNNGLRPENTYFQRNANEKEEFNQKLIPNNKVRPLISVNINPNPKFLTELPNFTNNLFLERLKEINLSKIDNFGIFKKVELKKPEFNLKDID